MLILFFFDEIADNSTEANFAEHVLLASIGIASNESEYINTLNHKPATGCGGLTRNNLGRVTDR